MAVDDLEFREFFAGQFGQLHWLGLRLTGNPGQAEELLRPGQHGADLEPWGGAQPHSEIDGR